MQIIALCAAQCLADDVDAWGLPILRALLPVAGMTVIEHQAERARTAGITSLLVLVDAVPAALADACDRIRSRSVDVRLVRTGADIARDCAAVSHILLVGDGLIAGDAAWRLAVADHDAIILTTPDGPMASGLERIDAATRWAGLAVVGRDLLSVLGDSGEGWDPQLVLFRAAVQAGLPRRACDSGLFVSGEMALAEGAQEAAGAAEQMMARQAVSETGIFSRWVAGPALQLLSKPLLGSQSSGLAVRAATPLFALFAAGAALLSQPLVMAGCGLVAAIAHQTGNFIARFRPEPRTWVIVARGGLVAQLLAMAIADRQMAIATDGAVDWGSGGVALPLMLVIGLLLPGAARVGAGRLVDPALAWVMLLLAVPALGWRAAFDGVGMVAAIALILAIVSARRIVSGPEET